MAQINNRTNMFNGLGTLTLTMSAAGNYTFDGKITLPTIPNGNGPSSLVVTIKQNGTTKYTGTAGAEGFHLPLTCAANDAIAIAFTSAAAADQQLNSIKSTITTTLGQ